jgi:hypothetical protein
MQQPIYFRRVTNHLVVVINDRKKRRVLEGAESLPVRTEYEPIREPGEKLDLLFPFGLE